MCAGVGWNEYDKENEGEIQGDDNIWIVMKVHFVDF